jgi:hypothetical protein
MLASLRQVVADHGKAAKGEIFLYEALPARRETIVRGQPVLRRRPSWHLDRLLWRLACGSVDEVIPGKPLKVQATQWVRDKKVTLARFLCRVRSSKICVYSGLTSSGDSGDALMARPVQGLQQLARLHYRLVPRLRRSANPLCFFGRATSSQGPFCARSENTLDQTLTLTCQDRSSCASRACLSSAGACWHSPDACPGVQDRAAWMKYGPLQFCFAQKRLLRRCCSLLLKHPVPVITALSDLSNC